MIRTFKHKGLRELFEGNRTRHVEQQYQKRCKEILDAVNAAASLRDLNNPGYRLHNLAPTRPATWTIRAYGAWRITFVFNQGDAYDVDLEQYH
jgi:proteic killer suppression protein